MNYGLSTTGLKNIADPRRRKLAGSLEGAVGRARSARTMQEWYGELVQGIRSIDAFGHDGQDPLPEDEDKDVRQRFQRTMFDDTDVRALPDYAAFRQPRDRGYDMLQEERMRDLFAGRNAPQPAQATLVEDAAASEAAVGGLLGGNGAQGTPWWQRAMENAFPGDAHPWQTPPLVPWSASAPRKNGMERQRAGEAGGNGSDAQASRGGSVLPSHGQDDPFAGTLLAANANARQNGNATDAGGGAGRGPEDGKAAHGRRTPPLEDFADPSKNILRPDKIQDYYRKPGDITKLHETTAKELATVSKSGSCGPYQLTGETLGDFMKSPEAANLPEKYRALKDNPKAIAAAWPEMAREHPDALAAANEAFIKRTHYEPTLKAFEKAGLDTGSEAIKNAAFSMGVLRGPNAFLKKVAKHLPDRDTLQNMGVEEQLDVLGRAFKMGYGGDREVKKRVDCEFNGNLINLHRALKSKAEAAGGKK
ncbi:hypothetical protein RVX_R00930 [Nitratidesulfovibrio sp. HK-II]|uniref:VgrG-related protein n=1 Tax=Nitratidesulfovibrio sp. HK-II TaxID=2009266 RepID=UPI000E2EF966|nr:hypothetical protein [Nitratidesulfovibrio sp. HK-II]GBO97330.1 hypothetical protein RVX_2369 [Nitratidesulfovibrio sp. HK-II]